MTSLLYWPAAALVFLAFLRFGAPLIVAICIEIDQRRHPAPEPPPCPVYPIAMARARRDQRLTGGDAA